MPVLRITYTRTDDSLPPPQDLAGHLTEVILTHHELSPWADQLRPMFRVRLHEIPQDRYLVGGRKQERAQYDIEYIVPSDTLTPAVRDALALNLPKAVLAWEGLPWDADDAMRVMLVITELPGGRWFLGGHAITPRWVLRYMGRLRRGEPRPARGLPVREPQREPA